MEEPHRGAGRLRVAVDDEGKKGKGHNQPHAGGGRSGFRVYLLTPTYFTYLTAYLPYRFLIPR